MILYEAACVPARQTLGSELSKLHTPPLVTCPSRSHQSNTDIYLPHIHGDTCVGNVSHHVPRGICALGKHTSESSNSARCGENLKTQLFLQWLPAVRAIVSASHQRSSVT